MGWVAAAFDQRYSDILPQNTFKVDVCVIGGGAAGTYAAIKSLDVNKTVVVVEQQDRLGGHTKTYIDPISKKPIELGVAEYEDSPIVRKWFARFNVPLYQYNFTIPGVTSEYVDFQTGQIATPKQGDLLGAWNAFQAQVAKYPSLDYSLDSVPFPVPADLLLPFGQFITKYNIQDAVPYLSLYGQGWGNFVTLPTLLAVKYFPPFFFSPASLSGGGGGAVAAKDNSLVYEKATKELGSNVLLNSTVIHMDRSAPDLVQIIVRTPTGKKLIHAKKLVSAIPPLIDNLKGFDLNKTETPIFNKFQGHSWYVGLVKNSGIPSNVSLLNYGTHNTQNFNIPVLPGIYEIFATVVPGLHYFLFGGNDSQPTFTQSQVKASLQDTLTRLRATSIIPKLPETAKALEIIDFSSHTPYEVYVPSNQIAKGFYNKLFALQGQRNTYWTGAAFVTHSSAAIWNYTDQLVTKMWPSEPEN
ncbi:beta-cyclopiazonate dehydrogenase [Physcia stellaris]|nr:beta-cyclopiazonate dehydrogenase [Physcia stellaris]